MKPEDIDRLTIADVRSINERAADVLLKFKELQSMMSGAVSEPPAPIPARIPSPLQLSDAEKARRAALLDQFPKEIQSAERGS